MSFLDESCHIQMISVTYEWDDFFPGKGQGQWISMHAYAYPYCVEPKMRRDMGEEMGRAGET